LEICRQQIAEADIFLCLLGRSYGSELGHEPKSFTEKEIDLATIYQKDFLLYVQSESTSSTRPSRLTSLIEVLRDELVGSFSATFDSIDDLTTRVKKDLMAWRRSPKAAVALAIEQLLCDPASRSAIEGLTENPRLAITHWKKHQFDPDYFDASLRDFRAQQLRDDYGEALRIGTHLLSYLSNTNPPQALQRENLEQWADFLLIYYNVLSVTGYLRSGPISAISLGKALFQIRRLLGDSTGAAYAAQAVSGVLNSASRAFSERALAWNEYALTRCSSPHILWSIWDSRGSILRRIGRLGDAVECLQRAASLATHSERDLAYVLARLGGVQGALGDTHGAINSLELSERISGNGLSRVIFIREWIPLLVKEGETEEARRYLHQGLMLCDSLGLQRGRETLLHTSIRAGLPLIGVLP
jgi:tetratricopeptide (TPR) repeat protein